MDGRIVPCQEAARSARFHTHDWFKCGALTPPDPHTFMGDDGSLLFRADENSQSGSSFPESGTSLRSVVSHHVTHATHAVIGKEDSGGVSHCERSLSSRLSSLPALCVPAPSDTHKIPQRRRFKSRRPHQPTHTHTKHYERRFNLRRLNQEKRKVCGGNLPISIMLSFFRTPLLLVREAYRL